MSTADVLDGYGDRADVCLLQFRSFDLPAFCGPIATVRCFEDNTLVRSCLEEAGEGRVLVVDGGESWRCALVGDNLARMAIANGWTGIVVYGCVRDSKALDTLQLGVKALGTNPRPSRKEGSGATEVRVTFGGVTFEPGAMLHADEDGVVVVPA